ncbi:hypothetical protein [Hymenobacter negativus]|uniref:Peptidase C39-like domain-containing protein n=1 Tax=Hymenobacter negativus TaxID=2795026 RepID=A0ABS0Q996_9BACT|nr:hypothetical protein [Hymenobacter negativus]MBH8559243.1 hypothetical protein [Hymenobacter negativus]
MPATQIVHQIVPYTEDALAEALSNDWVTPADTRHSQHYACFREYLGPKDDGWNAQTILVEVPYMSQSYLTDYANYYALCFTRYERWCKRIHFFRQAFAEEELTAALGDPQHLIWASYIGYIVVKPLPAPIGATLLRPYQNGDKKERHYPVQRPYHLNLLGQPLTVSTLIFQQQDTNVSACATTALWMAFHKTAFLFQTALPSPYYITEAAGNLFNHSGRSFPNKGLDTFQILNAIRSVGLVSELRNTYKYPNELEKEERGQQLREAKAFIHAYLRMGLPVLLFIKFENLGGHLVTATGYRSPEPDYDFSGNSMVLLSDGIKRMYVHDDGIGPYSRLGFNEETGMLETAWPQNSNWDVREQAWLMAAAVPLVSEIRIQYEQIYQQAAPFNDLFSILLPILLPTEPKAPLVWDIYLSFSNKYKEELLQSQVGSAQKRRQTAGLVLPKYVWIARASLRGAVVIDMVFDATDLHTGFFCQLVSVYSPLYNPLSIVLSDADIQRVLKDTARFDSRYFPLLFAAVGVVVLS